jgi:hypothetical protein
MIDFHYCFSLVAVEVAVHNVFRRQNFPRHSFVAALGLLLLFATCLPLVITHESSFGAAAKICLARRKTIDADMTAHSYLFPVHTLNVGSAFVSYFAFAFWFYKSPHRESGSEQAQVLDRKLGSFFGVQLSGNLAIICLTFSSCTANTLVFNVLVSSNLLALFGISGIITNLLCHRYLFERARIMKDEM